MITKAVKNMLLSHIEKTDLVTLGFLKNEIHTKLNWEHSKEFEFEGNMYDVVKCEEVGDSIYYLCWHDIKETNLNKRFIAFVNFAIKKDTKANKNLTSLITYLSILFINENHFFNNDNLFQKLVYKSKYVNSYKSIIISPNTPPPNC